MKEKEGGRRCTGSPRGNILGHHPNLHSLKIFQAPMRQVQRLHQREQWFPHFLSVTLQREQNQVICGGMNGCLGRGAFRDLWRERERRSKRESKKIREGKRLEEGDGECWMGF